MAYNDCSSLLRGGQGISYHGNRAPLPHRECDYSRWGSWVCERGQWCEKGFCWECWQYIYSLGLKDKLRFFFPLSYEQCLSPVLFKYNSSHYIFHGYGEVLLFAASKVLPMRSGWTERLSIFNQSVVGTTWLEWNHRIMGVLSTRVCLDKLITIILFFLGHKKGNRSD